MFLISLVLVLISSYFLTSCITKKNTGIIYFFLICFAQIVLTFEILSLLNAMAEKPFLIANVIFFIISSILIYSKRQFFKPQFEEKSRIQNALKSDILLLWISKFFIFFLICEFIAALCLPISFGDALSYYLPRCTTWIQQGNINHFVTPDTRELIMPVNMEFLYSWILMFTKSAQGIAIFSYISFLGAIYLIYNLLKEFKFCIRKRLWAIFAFSSLALVGIMAYTSCADLFIGSLLLGGIYLFIIYLKQNDKIALYLSTLSCALAFGTKTTAIIAFLGISMIFAIFTYKYKKEVFIKTALTYLGFLTLNFLIFSSYNYILNFLEFGNFISCPEQFSINKFQGGIKSYICTLIKYSFAIFDFSGVNNFEAYNTFITNLQTKTLALLGEAPNSYMSKYFPNNFQFNEDMTALTSGLGAIGLLCFLPALIISIIKKSNKKFPIFLLGFSFIINILIFSRVMVYTSVNLRYLLTFVVIASPILALTYIKSNKNIFKWIIFFLMFNYLVLNAYLKPYQHIIRTFDEKFNDTSYAIAQQAKKDELKIFDLFIKKEPTTIALIANSKRADLYAIEKLKLHGFEIDKVLAEDIDIYDLTKYEYIITTPYEITSTNIKYANNKNCTYIDTSTVKCLIPFEYLKKNGFNKFNNINFNNYVILKRNLIH